MSGNSYGSVCPNCNENMNVYEDHKPHPYVSGDCLYCGFYLDTKTNQLTLEELNEQRYEYNHGMGYSEGEDDYLPPLTELPKFDEQFRSTPIGA